MTDDNQYKNSRVKFKKINLNGKVAKILGIQKVVWGADATECPV